MYGNRKFIAGFALSLGLWAGPMHAATYVYVSNAEDGTIGMYTMGNDGALKPGAAIEAGKLVMPMSVSPDKRFLIAAVRSQPFSAASYAIDRATGALKLIAKAPLAESLPYISIDKSGKWLLGAAYGGHKVTVNPIGRDGTVGKESQVIPTALNAHAILTDKSNQYAFVPHLGTDQVFQFRFDARTGKLASNTPATVQMKSKTGPRHLIFSNDNKFVYLLNELTATVTTLAFDQKTGLLKQMSEASALPADSKLQPGAPRVPTGASGGPHGTCRTTSGRPTCT
jgi:6-phosphogluconolactonase